MEQRSSFFIQPIVVGFLFIKFEYNPDTQMNILLKRQNMVYELLP